MKHTLQKGFTLVEIAIVLVIIGLLLGGVLKGQEMITNAKIKKVENDFRGVSAAYYTYQDRFNRMPGDDSSAATRFAGTWAGADNGNGNGQLTSNWNSTTNTQESRMVWKHLRGAGLIAGPVDATAASYQQPNHAYGGIIGFAHWNRPYTTAMPQGAGVALCFGNMSGEVASILESRGDDGAPNTGAIIGNNTATAYTLTTTYNPLCFYI